MFEHIRWDNDCNESRNTDAAIERLRELGVISREGDVPHGCFERLRRQVREQFEIPWTSITPPMERFIYGISAVQQPANIVAIGIFCGNTLVWNVGASCGAGRCYEAEHVVGVEIEADSARLARSNFDRIGAGEEVQILEEDGHQVLDRVDFDIDLLYLDANGPLPGTEGPSTKMIYLSLLERAMAKLRPGSIVLAHDTIPAWFRKQAGPYLDFVRDDSNFRMSVSIDPDHEGIEVSVR